MMVDVLPPLGGDLVGVEVVVLFTRVTLVEALPPSCLVLVVSTSTVAWELCSVLDLVSSELCTALVAGDDFLNCSIQKKKMEKVHIHVEGLINISKIEKK